VLTGTTSLADGSWHHVVAVRDATADKLRLYVDGVLEAGPLTDPTTGGFASEGAPVNAGWINLSGAFRYQGNVDEIALYDRALSDTEVAEHYLGGVDGMGVCSAAVVIDIKPGSERNPLNLFSSGLIPVAILGSVTFDVTDVDVTTLAFGPDGAAPAHPGGGHPKDVNNDGFTDLVSHYWTAETGLSLGDEETCVTGNTLDGAPIKGCDVVFTLLRLFGVAHGGTLAITIDGVSITVATNAGDSTEQVLANLATAINEDATLQSLGTAATVVGDELITNGKVTETVINDTGLSGNEPIAAVPSLSPPAIASLAVLMAALGVLLRRQGQDRR
jgi:hypothetical protein